MRDYLLCEINQIDFTFQLCRPTHCAASKGRLDHLELLKKKKADMWQQSIRGEYPVTEASLNGFTG